MHWSLQLCLSVPLYSLKAFADHRRKLKPARKHAPTANPVRQRQNRKDLRTETDVRDVTHTWMTLLIMESFVNNVIFVVQPFVYETCQNNPKLQKCIIMNYHKLSWIIMNYRELPRILYLHFECILSLDPQSSKLTSPNLTQKNVWAVLGEFGSVTNKRSISKLSVL